MVEANEIRSFIRFLLVLSFFRLRSVFIIESVAIALTSFCSWHDQGGIRQSGTKKVSLNPSLIFRFVFCVIPCALRVGFTAVVAGTVVVGDGKNGDHLLLSLSVLLLFFPLCPFCLFFLMKFRMRNLNHCTENLFLLYCVRIL